ncbi:MAG: hypothetical protein RSD35_08470 [Oscillospiraceae bacterium]
MKKISEKEIGARTESASDRMPEKLSEAPRSIGSLKAHGNARGFCALRSCAEKISKSSLLPFAVLFAVFFAMHFNMTMGIADDSIYAAALSEKTLWEYSVTNYYSWSSRQLFEGIAVYIIHFPFLWRLLDSLMLVGAAVCLFKIYPARCEPSKAAWTICGLVAMYPMYHLITAGWVISTVLYIWALTLGLCSIMPPVRITRGQKVHWWQYPLCALATVFAANMEPVAVALLVVNVCLLIYNIAKKNKNIVYLFISSALVICDILYAYTCPGAAERMINETNGWFPEFASIPLWRKLEMGFSSTIRDFAMKPNLTFLLFAAVILVAVIIKTKKTAPRAFASVPLAVAVLLGFFGNNPSRPFNGLCVIVESIGKYGTAIRGESVSSWIPEIIMVGLTASIVVAICFAFDGPLEKSAAILTLTAGFGSRMVMSLSPTIWASGDRTYCFLYFAFYAVIYMLLTRTVINSDSKYRQPLLIFTGAVMLASLANMMALRL